MEATTDTHADGVTPAAEASQGQAQLNGPTANEIFEQLERFDFNDPEFTSGMAAITGPLRARGMAEEQIKATEDRAKLFFFTNKTGIAVDFDEYKAWKDGKAAGEPYPASFDAIVEMITTGRTDEIPGIKEIPLKINEDEPSESSLPKRSKPWESSVR